VSADEWTAEQQGASLHDVAVRVELDKIRARSEARSLFALEQSGQTTLPPLHNLSAFLQVPDEDVAYRMDSLWPTGGRVVLSAQHKAGKTTMIGNVIRSLVDGDDFLGTFHTQTAHRVVLIDNELDERMLRSWLRDQGVINTFDVDLLPLRGRVSTFNILDPATRARWAEHIKSADTLIFDCLRPALDALGLSEDKDAGRFLEAFDELTTLAGIPESMIVHHMGHNGERSRGDSRIQDWPDALWTLVKDKDPDDGTPQSEVSRYFSAYGRDVDFAQSLLGFDLPTRRLSIVGGSRGDEKGRKVVPALLEYIQGCVTPPSKNQVEKECLTEHPRADIRSAVRIALKNGQIEVRQGPRNASLLCLMHPQFASSPQFADSSPGEVELSSPVRLIGGELNEDVGEHPQKQFAAANSDACTNRNHTPKYRGGRWTCSDCDQGATA
jgi:hypothetical protein